MKKVILALLFGVLSSNTYAARLTVPVYLTAEGGVQQIGTVTIESKWGGLLFSPQLEGLPSGPGIHGFHIHEHASCADHGKDAGGHLDPKHTGKHEGPYGKGHLGDLPVLIVDSEGKATVSVLAPRLHMADIVGHTLMIHEGGDNYSDKPENGGGGARIACGVIKK